MSTDLAVTASLRDMKESLLQDLKMLRNYRSVLVKTQSFGLLDSVQVIEASVQETVNRIEAALA